MEEWQHGGLYIVDDQAKWEYISVKLKDVTTFSIDVSGLSPEEATRTIIEHVKVRDTNDKIVTLRIKGEINGKTSDVSFGEVYKYLDDAYFVLKNTAKLRSKESMHLINKAGSVEEIENQIMKEVVSELKIKEDEDIFIKALMGVLDKDRGDGEKVADFEKRLTADALKVLEIETE